jgi:hypothetical protein
MNYNYLIGEPVTLKDTEDGIKSYGKYMFVVDELKHAYMVNFDDYKSYKDSYRHYNNGRSLMETIKDVTESFGVYYKGKRITVKIPFHGRVIRD